MRAVANSPGLSTPSAFGTLLRNEGDPPTGNVQVDRVYDFAGDTYDYYASEHGRGAIEVVRIGRDIIAAVSRVFFVFGLTLGF